MVEIVVTSSPAASLDDAHMFTSTKVMDTTATKIDLLHGRQGGFRFPNILIPNGATIAAVTFSYRAFGTNDVNHQWFIENVDDAADYSSTLDGRTYVSGGILKDTGQVGDNTVIVWDSVTFPAMVARVQTVVNRAGWAPGNAMACMLFSSFVSPAAGARSYDFSTSTSQTATLSITYEGIVPGGGGGPVQELIHSVVNRRRG
jgi:hypothetical protein